MSLLDTPIARLDGTPSTLGELTGGRPALIVNVASKCGFTSQYAGLEQLHEKFADRGFTVVGVPCNQFGGQEPGTSEEIAEFCSTTYGVTFPMTEKVHVRGPHSHPLFAEEAVGVNVNLPRIADVKEALAGKAAQTPPGHWVRGVMYDDTIFEDERPLQYVLCTRFELAD